MICIARHIKAYHRQCFDREMADFGEPCSDCEFYKTCKFDWFARMKPLFENTNITIQLGRQAHSSKKRIKRGRIAGGVKSHRNEKLKNNNGVII